MIFLDSNIVITFFCDGHEHHERSHSFVIEKVREGIEFVISPQVFGESFRALTSPQSVEQPIKPEEFLRVFKIILKAPNIQMVSPGIKAVDLAFQTAAKIGVTSHRIYDLIIYGTMLEHGITKIATFNEKHFRNLEGIELVEIP